MKNHHDLWLRDVWIHHTSNYYGNTRHLIMNPVDPGYYIIMDLDPGY
jgi:hypothetical protein